MTSHSYRITLQLTGFLLALALGVYSIAGQTQRRFYPLSDQADLSHSTVLSINKDSRGFLWIGTQDGLNRYDGYKCKQYRWEQEGGLRISYIDDIGEGPDGDMWICSHEGLFRFDIETENITNAFEEGSPLRKTHGDMVTRIDMDSKGKLWVGSYYGLLHWDPKTGEYDRYTTDPDNPHAIPEGWERIRSMCLQDDRTLWVGSFAGLMVLDVKTGRFDKIDIRDLGVDAKHWSQIFDIRYDHNGIIWVSTQSNGLIAIDSLTRRGLPFNQSSIYRLSCTSAIYGTAADSIGRIWIGTDHGLHCYDPVRETLESFHHDLSDPFSLGEDIIARAPLISDDIMWLPSPYAGVWSTDLRPTFFTPYSAVLKNGLDYPIVSSFAEEKDGNLVIATDGGGLNIMDLSTGKFSYYLQDDPPFNLPTCKTLAVIIDTKGRYWIGTWNRGLVRYDPETGEHKTYLPDPDNLHAISGRSVFSLLEDSKGRIWVGLWDGGVSCYDEEIDGFINYWHDPDNPDSMVEVPIMHLMEDRAGNIWISSEIGGLCKLSPDTGEIEVYKHAVGKNSLNSNSINCTWEDPQGLIYIGTNAGGLNLLDPRTGRFLDNPLNNGDICSSILGIESDPYGMVWLSTNNGLLRYDYETSLLNIYTKNDGIHDNRFGKWAFTRLSSGDLLFGGPSGFTWVHSDETNPEEVFPDPVITGVWTNDKFYKSLILSEAREAGEADVETSVFPGNVKSLQFEFSTPWYRGNDRIDFQYRLVGIDQGWVSVHDSRVAQYRNLSHGSYRFEVRVSNLEGRWNKRIASFPFVIRTPWLLRWYSKFFFTLLGIGLIMLLVRWRVYRYRKRGIELEQRIQERTRDLNESNRQLSEKKYEIELQNQKLTQVNLTKDKMLSIFAHDIKNPFNALLSLSEILNNEYDLLNDNERKEYIEFIRTSSNNIYELLENLLYWSISQEHKLPYRPDFIWADEVFESAFKLYKVIAAQKSINLESNISRTSKKLWMDSQLITMVFRNLLNNAIKFTPMNGTITVESRETSREVIFCVSDSGAGMSDEQANRIFKHKSSDRNSAEHDAKGTGLGLPLCREIVELHHGRIYKDTDYEEGLRICFTIPFDIVEREDPLVADATY